MSIFERLFNRRKKADAIEDATAEQVAEVMNEGDDEINYITEIIQQLADAEGVDPNQDSPEMDSLIDRAIDIAYENAAVDTTMTLQEDETVMVEIPGIEPIAASHTAVTSALKESPFKNGIKVVKGQFLPHPLFHFLDRVTPTKIVNVRKAALESEDAFVAFILKEKKDDITT